MFLLIDKGRNARLLPYEERYLLFHDFEDCKEAAIDRGFEQFLMKIAEPKKAGVMSSYSCGDVDIGYMRIEFKGRHDN